MNGFEIAFWGAVVLSIFGWLLDIISKLEMRYNKNRIDTRPKAIRTWLPVSYVDAPPEHLTVRVVDSGKNDVASHLNAVRDTPFEKYEGMTYSDVLSTVTPEEATLIKELKEFLL